MPAISFVVCVRGERVLLERLLKAAEGCYDELIVVHDGQENDSKTLSAPLAIDFSVLTTENCADTYRQPNGSPIAGSIHELVRNFRGRFYEGPRCYQQEPHWPFAWRQATHDWILRLDADEIPSGELQDWLHAFREAEEPTASISGYSCVWPLWNGQAIVTKSWPAGRAFLFHRQRVRFFGMVEQTPVPEMAFQPLPLILEHRPARKSYGLRNVLLRPQAYHWRRVIARSLLGRLRDLPRWRWIGDEWPTGWEQIRKHPLRTGLTRLLLWPPRALRDFWKHERQFLPAASVSGGIHHCLIAFEYWRLRRLKLR